MWRYKGTKEYVLTHDIVKVSKRWCKTNGVSEHVTGEVVDRCGYIRVHIPGFGDVDFDARSLTLIRRGTR